MVIDQGIIQGNAAETLRKRSSLVPDVKILADVHVKHAFPLGAENIESAAFDCWDRGRADAPILTGAGTGRETPLDALEKVRQQLPQAKIFIGSGVNTENVHAYKKNANGFIVGSSLKRGGKINEPVDPKRVELLRKKLDE